MLTCVGTMQKRIDLIMLPRHESLQFSGELLLALQYLQTFMNQEFLLRI